jgi:two-component system response regulator FixJ
MARVEPTVFIVDDDEAVRASLQALAASVGFATRAYSSAQAFLDEYDPRRPGCAVIDVRLRGMSGLDLQQEMREREMPLPVIIVTGHGDIPMCAEAIRSGAVDFIEKPYRDQVMLDRLREAIEQDREGRRAHQLRCLCQDRLQRLTRREREVLAGIVNSKANKEIAADLGISVRAVESHRARLMERMEAAGVADLMRTVMLAEADDLVADTVRI